MTTLTPEQIEFLQKNISLNEMIKKSNFVRNYPRETYFEFLEIYEQHISKKHNFTFNCSECRFFLAKYVFQYFEQTQKMTIPEQIENEDTEEEELIIAVFSPKQIQVETPEQTPVQTPEKRKYKKRTPKI